MAKSTSVRVRRAPLFGVFALLAYQGESLASADMWDDDPEALAEPASPVPPQAAHDVVSAPPAANPTGPAPSSGPSQPAAAAKPAAKPATVALPPPAPPPPPPSGPPPLTWFGVTLYGVVDVGVAHLSHGAPPSNSYPAGLPYIVQPFSNHSLTSLANNGLSQSRLGLSGIEPLGLWNLQGVFKLETGFQPTTGRLSDGPKSLIDNNGRANADKVTAGDSSRAGQPFQSAAYAGLSSATVGTLTFGRQNSLMADELLKYDPQLQSQAFSPIGYAGAAGGLGDTEDKVLDQALKYSLGVGPLHLAALYQFGNGGFEPGGSQALDIGLDVVGLSVDFVWGRVRGAVSAASLTAAQNAAAPGTLAATVSDNTGFAIMGRYAFRSLKLYASYEHMTFANPRDALPAGTVIIGGYVLSNVNNTAYTIQKVLQYLWFGARWAITPTFEVSAAYYQLRQNSYNANACSDTSASSCSGLYHLASLVLDYRLSLRFDVYAGVGYSRATEGMAAGYLNDDNWTSMLGIRFVF